MTQAAVRCQEEGRHTCKDEHTGFNACEEDGVEGESRVPSGWPGGCNGTPRDSTSILLAS